MREKLGNLTIRNFIIVYILLYSIMPIVNRLTSRYLTTYFYMAVVVALVALILILDRPDNLNVYGSFLLPFIIYGLLTRVFSNATVVLWGYQTLLLWLPVILGYYLTQDQTRLRSSYSAIIILALVVTMVTTIIGCIRNPNAARILATVNSGDAKSITYDMQNIGGYSFVYYMILLYPVLILSYKTKRIGIITTLIITAVILVTTIYSEYTTALLLFIISSFLFFTKRTLSPKGIIAISAAAVILLLFFTNAVADFLRWLGDLTGSEAISMRLDALAGGAEGLEASEDNRMELYRMSLNTFAENPFFGTIFEGRRYDGGHSFILDNLAQFGILGAGLMYFMYNRIFRGFFLPFKDKPGYGYIIWTFIQAIILSLINTGFFLEVLCLFAPLLFYWIYGTEAPIEASEEPATEEDKENKEYKEAEETTNDEDTVDRQHASGTAG